MPQFHVELDVDTYPRDEFDEVLEDALNHDPKLEKWFYSKVAGVTHCNDDGSSRQDFISECKPLDVLLLKLEPNNPVDKQAVAVYRNCNHAKLGYLNERLAHETLERTRNGEKWGALVARKRGVTDDRDTLGLTIVMVKWKAGM
jgi:hypothetical protein